MNNKERRAKNAKRILAMALAIILLFAFAACKDKVAGEESGNEERIERTGEDNGVIHGPGTVGIGVNLCSHKLYEGDNVVVHEPVGYCGNTMTTVRYTPMGKTGEPWEKTFAGSESVGLTDFVRWLHYSDGICRCLPEYTVVTEFGDEYGVNLTDGYVRHGDKQVSLTEDQVTYLKATMEVIKLLPVEVSYTPLAE